MRLLGLNPCNPVVKTLEDLDKDQAEQNKRARSAKWTKDYFAWESGWKGLKVWCEHAKVRLEAGVEDVDDCGSGEDNQEVDRLHGGSTPDLLELQIS